MANATLLIQVQPRAGKTEIVGWHGDAVKIQDVEQVKVIAALGL